MPSISAINQSSGPVTAWIVLGVKRGRLELAVPEHDQDDADVDVLIEQVGGKFCRSVCGLTRLRIPAALAAS